MKGRKKLFVFVCVRCAVCAFFVESEIYDCIHATVNKQVSKPQTKWESAHCLTAITLPIVDTIMSLVYANACVCVCALPISS